jgi:hypothetical protein
MRGSYDSSKAFTDRLQDFMEALCNLEMLRARWVRAIVGRLADAVDE